MVKLVKRYARKGEGEMGNVKTDRSGNQHEWKMEKPLSAQNGKMVKQVSRKGR